MRWAQKQRVAFIGRRLLKGASVNRTDITTEFDVSLQQASADIGAFNKSHPGAMKYDSARKAYVADCLTLDVGGAERIAHKDCNCGLRIELEAWRKRAEEAETALEVAREGLKDIAGRAHSRLANTNLGER